MRGLFGEWTGCEGGKGRGLEPLKSLRWDEVPERKGIDSRHCGMEGRGKGTEVEPVEGALLRWVIALPLFLPRPTVKY